MQANNEKVYAWLGCDDQRLACICFLHRSKIAVVSGSSGVTVSLLSHSTSWLRAISTLLFCSLITRRTSRNHRRRHPPEAMATIKYTGQSATDSPPFSRKAVNERFLCPWYHGHTEGPFRMRIFCFLLNDMFLERSFKLPSSFCFQLLFTTLGTTVRTSGTAANLRTP